MNSCRSCGAEIRKNNLGELRHTCLSAKDAYEAGWLEAASWAGRDDLIQDVDSHNYVECRNRRMSK